LNKMPKKLSSVAEAMTAVMQIIGTSKESLKKILVRGEFDEFPDDKHMHCKARLVEMLNKCSDQLHECNVSDPKSNFLLEEIAILEEAKVLQGKVKGISSIPIGFVEQVWSYIEDVVLRAGHNLIEKMKERSINWMTEIVEMEKLTDYT
ncbi:PREDICTED: dynamin-related, partial [Prunus dulcis]